MSEILAGIIGTLYGTPVTQDQYLGWQQQTLYTSIAPSMSFARFGGLVRYRDGWRHPSTIPRRLVCAYCGRTPNSKHESCAGCGAHETKEVG